MPPTRVTSANVKDASLTDVDIAAANKDGTQATPSLRTISTSAPADLGVAAAGNGVTASAANHVHAARVSKTDAVSAASDYLARIKLAADTTYRASLGISADDSGALEFGAGGTAARDMAIKRSGSGSLQILDLSDTSPVTLRITGSTGSAAYLALYRQGDSQYRSLMTEDGLRAGSGSAIQDLGVYRSAAKTLTVDDNAAGAATLVHSGLQRFGGTTFPGSPSTNDRFYRTDRNLEYYYDGTRWLTTTEGSITLAPTDTLQGGSSAPSVFTAIEPGANGVYVTRVRVVTYCGITNATNFLTYQFSSEPANPATDHNLGTSFTTANDTQGEFVAHLITVNAIVTAGDLVYALRSTKTLSPLGLYGFGTVFFRQVG